MALFIVGVAVLLASSAPSGAVLRNQAGLWTQVALFACAAALPLSVRSIDFSLAGTAAVCGVVFGLVGGVPGLLVGLVVAVVIGVVNGALAGLLDLHPAMTTFATGMGLTGIVVLATSARGKTIDQPLPPAFAVAVLVLLFAVAVAVDAVTVANVQVSLPDTVRRASMHAAAGVLAGLAGIVSASTIRYVAPNLISSNLLLLGFAAAAIGGTSALGGWRSLLGAVLAAGFLAAVQQVQALLGLPTYISWFVAIGVLLVGLGGDRLRAYLMRSRGPNAVA